MLSDMLAFFWKIAISFLTGHTMALHIKPKNPLQCLLVEILLYCTK